MKICNPKLEAEIERVRSRERERERRGKTLVPASCFRVSRQYGWNLGCHHHASHHQSYQYQYSPFLRRSKSPTPATTTVAATSIYHHHHSPIVTEKPTSITINSRFNLSE
ncbi:hypothetical protein HanRHA438_Chr06g0269231 [Helianthus annuus]|nr:hypothetical protein HanRHA438_Chr06g0269231 [Helianthus annuus]